MSDSALKTPLHASHLQLDARMVDFGGWDMPINYGSQIEEHHAVRRQFGVFDVSHMTVVDLAGEKCREFLSRLLANDVDKLKIPGKALYSCMLNQQGGVIDDLITYYLDESHFRMVVNASTREKDLEWIRAQAVPFHVQVTERSELAMIAVQGPAARQSFADLMPPDLSEAVMRIKRFSARDIDDPQLFVARTGYTGEDGFELVMPAADAPEWWDQLIDAGARPCGLGARDTLRLEAGMNLYGQDMDEFISPLEAGLAWTVAMKRPGDDTRPPRHFLGRDALAAQMEKGVTWDLVGLILQGRGVLRHGQKVICPGGEGVITSGTFSPTLERSIAFARVPVGTTGEVSVEVRNRQLQCRVVSPPFVRDGKPDPALFPQEVAG